jgi:hypothetical protein
MELTETSAYVAIVGDDHTIILPAEIPVGSRVTITVIPPPSPAQTEDERLARFAATKSAIQNAIKAQHIPPALSASELQALIRAARKASQNP